MKLLLTGSTGRVGTALVDALIGSVHLVLLVRDDSPVGRERALRLFDPSARKAYRDGRLEFVAGDLEKPRLGLDDATRASITNGLSRIVHLAALTDFSSPGDDRHARINVGGALALAELAAHSRIPYLLVSTAYVSGDRDGRILEDEGDVGQAFRNPYEQSKLAAEIAVTTAAQRGEFPLSIFRLGVVLPNHPTPSLPTGPGPLIFLEFLASLKGRGFQRTGRVRYPGDPSATLNMVGLDGVVGVLAHAALRPTPMVGTFHVTSKEPTSITALAQRVNEHLPTLEIVLADPVELADSDRVERMLAKHCRPYEPYLFAHALHDRSRLEAELPSDIVTALDLGSAELRRIFGNHVSAWRGTRRTETARPRAERAIEEYFDSFLPARTGRRLVPGLETLTADFTVSVPDVGIYRLSIDRGVLTHVRRADRRSDQIDYESDAGALAEAIAGEKRPSQLFFERRVTIRGDLYRALSTATALEDFFRLHPFATNQARPA